MLKRLISLLLALTMLFSLSSCFLPEGGTDTGNGTNPDNSTSDSNNKEEENTPPTEDQPEGDPDGLIYGPKSAVVIIKSDKDKITDLNSLTSKIYKLSGKFAVVEMDSSSQKEREIVVGDTARDISSTAKQLLDEQMAKVREEYAAAGKYDKMVGGFAVYAEECSVSIVWSDDDFAQKAVDYFVEMYVVGSTLAIEDKGFEFVPYDIADDIIAEQKAEQEAAWARAEEMYGSETVAALRAHLDMFDERFYLWLADLYESEATDLDGNVIGGGFYYSNSARDNISYAGVTLLPDLESTSQVLSFIQNSGMLGDLSYSEILPEEMRQQIINFARALQSSKDGYFYHPQWGTSISTSRRSRDCGWGATILTRLGSRPYWNTPSGTSGIYGAPGSSATALTEPLSTPRSAAITRAVAASDTWTGASHLATLSAWESYLKTQTATIRINSYSIGNTIGSQNAQIKNRDKLALKTGECKDLNGDGIADGGYIETLINLLDELQLENGLWESTVSYNSVNGLMKIMGCYTNLGFGVKRGDKALEAAVSMITDDTPFDGITDVYNPWVAVNSILNNITNYGDPAESTALRNMIKANALEMITATSEKVSEFAKEDGSYSYDPQYSPYKSQGAIVAVRYTSEGDVNGGTIAYTGIWRNMCSVLEIDIYPLTFEDFIKFIERVEY